jgi:hypothetical protein
MPRFPVARALVLVMTVLGACFVPRPSVAGELLVECRLVRDLRIQGQTLARQSLVNIIANGAVAEPLSSHSGPLQFERDCENSPGLGPVLILKGVITNALADAFVAVVDDLILRNRQHRLFVDDASGFRSVSLDSSGGDVLAAIRIGRKVREAQMHAEISPAAVCQSACVFVLAGAVVRESYGEVAIHRAYFRDLPAGLSQAEVTRRIRRLDGDIRAYLREMNVPEALLDRMRAVPPDQMERLTPTELSRMLLNGNDPVYDERVTAARARTHGTSSAEFRRRAALASQECRMLSGYPTWNACYEAILYGLSQQVFLERQSEAARRCAAEYEANWNRFSFASAQALEACRFRIMIQ